MYCILLSWATIFNWPQNITESASPHQQTKHARKKRKPGVKSAHIDLSFNNRACSSVHTRKCSFFKCGFSCFAAVYSNAVLFLPDFLKQCFFFMFIKIAALCVYLLPPCTTADIFCQCKKTNREIRHAQTYAVITGSLVLLAHSLTHPL